MFDPVDLSRGKTSNGSKSEEKQLFLLSYLKNATSRSRTVNDGGSRVRVPRVEISHFCFASALASRSLPTLL